jgi:hypothetical protein
MRVRLNGVKINVKKTGYKVILDIYYCSLTGAFKGPCIELMLLAEMCCTDAPSSQPWRGRNYFIYL